MTRRCEDCKTSSAAIRNTKRISAVEKRLAEIDAILREMRETTIRYQDGISHELTRIYDLCATNQKMLTALVSVKKENGNGNEIGSKNV